ncbi:hypothetical protein [Adhaeribacter terreus]|uniref:Capsule assembly Wzi family protein n=1 Tax=Adhaeribacter terreus TaxID=529703 RepID=A0ABW0E7C1_9BACT
MPFFRLFFGVLLIFLAQVSFAQLPNQAFYTKDDKVEVSVGPTQIPGMIVCGDFYSIYAYPKGYLELNIKTLGFFKDNEYFNKIADGYTLFGYQLNPSLQYYASEKIRIEAGALLLKDFGNNKYKLIQPTFTATFSTGNHTVLFGTLYGNLNFGYIEPLWDFERQLTKPVQNGIQYIYKGRKLDLQTWVDWQVMQYEFDTKQEEIAGGFISNINLLEKQNILTDVVADGVIISQRNQIKKISIPIQFTAKHKGGQIDINDRPLTTIFNGAIGIEASKSLSDETSGIFSEKYNQRKPFLKSLYTKNYFVAYNDHSFTHQLPFQSGSGIYLNAGADTRWANFMLSYWHGNGYISEFGGKLYQSASTTVHNPTYVEKKRDLLMLRVMKDWNAGDGLTFTGRLEPFYDFTTNSTEFSAGLYLNFNTDFYLTKLKRNSTN